MNNRTGHRSSEFPKARNRGILTTIVVHSLLLVFLIVAGFVVSPVPENSNSEGIMVNFGTDETGFGDIEPSPPAYQEELPPPPPVQQKAKVQEEQVITQDNAEAPKAKTEDPEAAKKRMEKLEADRKLKEQLDAERLRRQQEEAERKRIEAEQQRQADIMNRTRNALANSRNSGTNSTGEGVAGGPGNQGVPTGSVDSKVRGPGGGFGTGGGGISYDLGGRGSQSLPSPKYDYQGEGKVVVEVTVDRAGNVIQANPGSKGSTTLDEYLLKVAKEAALKAKFERKDDAPAVQKGTITYNFFLK